MPVLCRRPFLVPAVVWMPREHLAVAEQEAEERARDEAPHVRPERDAAALRTDRDGPAHDLYVIASAKPKEDAERLLKRFLPRAFRRHVTDDEAAYFVKVAHDALDNNEPFVEVMIAAFKTVLCSPHFLFLTQQTTKHSQLNDFALAARLSGYQAMRQSAVLAVREDW